MPLTEKFWTYLGFSDKILNERQLLKLICLLGKENITLILPDNEIDLLNKVLSIYIDAFETNSFKVLTEERIVEELCYLN